MRKIIDGRLVLEFEILPEEEETAIVIEDLRRQNWEKKGVPQNYESKNNFCGLLAEWTIFLWAFPQRYKYPTGDFVTIENEDLGYDALDLELNQKCDSKAVASNPPFRWRYDTFVFDYQLEKHKYDYLIWGNYQVPERLLIIAGWTTIIELKERGKFYPKGSIKLRGNGSEMRVTENAWFISFQKTNPLISLFPSLASNNFAP